MLPSNLVSYEFSDSEDKFSDSDGQEDFFGLNTAHPIDQTTTEADLTPPHGQNPELSSPLHENQLIADATQKTTNKYAIDQTTTEADLTPPHGQNPELSSPLQENQLIADTTQKTTKKYAIDFKLLPTDMKKFLQEVKLYFTKPINLQRQRPPVAESTYTKAQERLLCFLGFARDVLCMQLSPDLFLRIKIIEDYLTYLKMERGLTPYTMSNHAAALLYPAKFLNGEYSPEYTNVEIIKRIRGQVSSLQRAGNREQSSTKEDLIEKNRWLDWDEVVTSVGLQRERMEMARTAASKAEECADLVLVSLYVLMPPCRGYEIRTLEILPQELSLTTPDMATKNLIQVQSDGGVTFRFQKYKTVKTYGSDTTILKNDHELSRILRDYINNHRAKLIKEGSGNFLLVNSSGKPYTGSAFCSRIKFLFHRLTGVSLSVNGLRSSFVTHTYSRSDCSDSLKDSVAAALRHSRKQAQQTYDRRNSNERKQLALSLCSDLAQDETADSAEQESGAESRGSLKVGDFVGLVEEGSTLSNPRVLIGRIQSFRPNRQASLLWFKPCGKDEYVFEFGAEPWLESIEAMVAVKMKSLKKKPGVFKLNTTTKSIHEHFQ